MRQLNKIGLSTTAVSTLFLAGCTSTAIAATGAVQESVVTVGSLQFGLPTLMHVGGLLMALGAIWQRLKQAHIDLEKNTAALKECSKAVERLTIDVAVMKTRVDLAPSLNSQLRGRGDV